MDDSILVTIKKMLGLTDNYTPYDMDVIVLINAAFMTLHQLHVGPSEGFSIKDYTSRWGDFIVNPVMLNAVQEYVYMKVKMVFDPPGNSFVMEALKQQCQEIEWRLNVQAESVEEFDFVKQEDSKCSGKITT